MPTFSRRSLLRAAALAPLAATMLGGGAKAARQRALVIQASGARPPQDALDAFTARSGIMVELAPANAMSADLMVVPHDSALLQRPGALRGSPRGALPLDALAPGLAALSAPRGGDVVWHPAGWSAQGIAWRADRWTPWGAPSYADLWDGRAACGDARALLLGAGLHLEATGALAPGALWAAHGDDAAAARVWARIAAWCAPRAAALRTGGGAAGALEGGAASAALTDAASAAQAARAGAPVGFAAPAEGAIARMWGFAIPAQAARHDGAAAFMSFMMERDGGMADWTGGASMGPDALAALHPLPAETPGHAALRRAVAAQVFG
jgi:spermidine/putrescine transport system substrate-binding protein